MISFNCPTCGKSLQIAPEHGGQAAQCPGCQGRITVPQALPPMPPPVQAGFADRPPLAGPPPVQSQGMSTSTILLIVGGAIFGVCGLPLLIVICLAAITALGKNANTTFEEVGKSLTGS